MDLLDDPTSRLSTLASDMVDHYLTNQFLIRNGHCTGSLADNSFTKIGTPLMAECLAFDGQSRLAVVHGGIFYIYAGDRLISQVPIPEISPVRRLVIVDQYFYMIGMSKTMGPVALRKELLVAFKLIDNELVVQWIKNYITGVTADRDGNLVTISPSANRSVAIYNSDGNLIREWGLRFNRDLAVEIQQLRKDWFIEPTAITIDHMGNYLIMDSGIVNMSDPGWHDHPLCCAIRIFDKDGKFLADYGQKPNTRYLNQFSYSVDRSPSDRIRQFPKFTVGSSLICSQDGYLINNYENDLQIYQWVNGTYQLYRTVNTDKKIANLTISPAGVIYAILFDGSIEIYQ